MRSALFLLSLLICVVLGAEGRSELPLQPRKHKNHEHELLLLMGGLKSLAVLVLVKIKIVLVLAAFVALGVFTAKYLLGAADLGFLYKSYAAPQPLPQPAYLHTVHEPHIYGYGYQTPIPWDHVSHEGQVNEWSKLGDGGRSIFDIMSLYPNFGRVLLQNTFKHRKKRKRNVSIINMYSYN